MSISNPDAPFVPQAEKDFPRNSFIIALMLVAIGGAAAVASNWDTVTQQFHNQ